MKELAIIITIILFMEIQFVYMASQMDRINKRITKIKRG